MLIFCDFIQVYVFTTNHHLNEDKRNQWSVAECSLHTYGYTIICITLLIVFPVDYGDWFDYVLEMEEIIKKEEYNIHLVYYEDLKEVRRSSRVHYSRSDIDTCISKRDMTVVPLAWTYNNKSVIFISMVLSSGSEFDPCSRQNLPNRKRGSIANSLSLSTSHRPDMTEIPLKRT